MNDRFTPGQAFALFNGDAKQSVGNAIVTASYASDFERCALLCETIDRYVAGWSNHYILVENRDVALFSQLASARRIIVPEGDILPSWLKPIDDPLSGMKRRLWLSWRTAPLRGWHVQQLRRIAIASHLTDDALIYIDSDVAFVKPFDCGAFWKDDRLRLFRRDFELADKHGSEQQIWSRHAGDVLGIRDPQMSPHDYITTLIAWKRGSVIGMCERIETLSERHWVSAIATRRQFSECMIYGRYADEILMSEGHFADNHEFCRIHWSGDAMNDAELKTFIDTMAPAQVAIGMQSFLGTDVSRIRRLLEAVG